MASSGSKSDPRDARREPASAALEMIAAPEEPKGDPRGPAPESAALKRLKEARRNPTQLGTAVECMEALKADLDREYQTAKDEAGLLAHVRALVERGLALAGIGHVL